MLNKSEIQNNLSKLSFCKSLSPGENWKSKSMRIIPEELLNSKSEDFEYRVVFEVRWGNSWQLWLEQDKKGLFMIEEDWNEFVDDNFLGPNDILFFRHVDTIYYDVRIMKKNGKEVMDYPHEVEPETEAFHLKPHNSHQETNSAFASANGGTNGQARRDCAYVINPERCLLNPENPFFVKNLKKRNDVLYVSRAAIQRYGLKFGATNSAVKFIMPNGNEEKGYTKMYGNERCFTGWSFICRTYNLKQGDTVVCELERSGGIVTAVRVHFLNVSP